MNTIVRTAEEALAALADLGHAGALLAQVVALELLRWFSVILDNGGSSRCFQVAPTLLLR